MNFENRPTHSLRPYPGNARTHSPKQIRQIAKSIERFGFNNPVLVDDDDQIIAGHGRVEAAKLLHLKTVPTVRLSHLSDDDRRRDEQRREDHARPDLQLVVQHAV